MTASNIKSTPYWWESAPLVTPSEQILPTETDVLVVGAGYSGLSAAITLVRAGTSALVLDRQVPGEGASSRNGGMATGNIRLSFADMVRNFGKARALGVQAEGKAAREDLRRFIQDEGIDCDYRLCGQFSGALSRADYDASARSAEALAKALDIDSYAVPRSVQHQYIGTDLYCGGAVRMDIGGLDPGKFYAGMLRVAQEAGAVVQGETAVLSIDREGTSFTVATSRGKIRAGQVLVCTNGYTDASDRWLRRRIVPVRSRIIATEPLPRDLMNRLMPTQMMYGDGRKLSYYYRPSPDGTRILFGGRDGTVSGDPAWPTEHLRVELGRIFPELAKVSLSHSWFGYVAMHRDMIPRLFRNRGVIYATGYCGSGVVWARWLGMKAALQILGNSQAGRTVFDFGPPKSIPLFTGKAWFMPFVYAKMEFEDRRLLRRNGKEDNED
ncbi:FAD-binding oxidoreductase [Mesorhizobium sp.]|uniref:NAD(P)/FAD-dependent oxidoreductase n=1 Tax=Mesorhizobium sp. TaxID=1871066 RepID=UPI000FE51D1A|nr:FAD-binding oxidoreductase [Mesorhizobium sp.]RWA97308.1 MAG: FAD-binding oxidoreductase [Mesorhizobium sp.]